MDNDFAVAVAAFNTFFSAAAGVSATLIGLLFVALALNPAIMADDGPAGLRVWSGLTFHSFLMVLTLSLIAILPFESGDAFTITFVLVGISGLLAVARAVWGVRRDPDPDWRLSHAISRFFSPLLAYGICLWAAYLAWHDNPDALSWTVPVIFLLVMSAASSCWDLLKDLGNPKRTDAAQ
jgi:hypothetical protein